MKNLFYSTLAMLFLVFANGCEMDSEQDELVTPVVLENDLGSLEDFLAQLPLPSRAENTRENSIPSEHVLPKVTEEYINYCIAESNTDGTSVIVIASDRVLVRKVVYQGRVYYGNSTLTFSVEFRDSGNNVTNGAAATLTLRGNTIKMGTTPFQAGSCFGSSRVYVRGTEPGTGKNIILQVK